MYPLNKSIEQAALRIQQQCSQPLAAYLYDIPALRQHLQTIKADLPEQVELFYAVKANPDPKILQQVASIVDGLEIASGGELTLIRPYLNNKPFIFGGPAKLDEDISKAIIHKVETLHVESCWELERIIQLAAKHQHVQPILLRLNPILPQDMQTILMMAGRATAFGIDESSIAAAIKMASISPWVDLQGFHIHALSHQLDASKHLQLLAYLLEQTVELAQQHKIDLKMINLGGGIGINYRVPHEQYLWPEFVSGIKKIISKPEYSHLKIRFEMGRYLTAFCGYYLMEVLDLKSNHEQHFAICRGGTHQFRLPAAQGHSHPFVCLSGKPTNQSSPVLTNTQVTIAGQLCTPKDIMATNATVNRISIGDLLIFPLAGAYAWNISHQQFLCHPAPEFHYLEMPE
jgi:diaminopimelate decarboxylase